jgi:phosphatidylglycerophosphate synthase
VPVSVYDGFISRGLNRRFSRPLARLLSYTPATPNQVSVASLGVAVAAFVLYLYGYHIAAGLSVQASSIVDGVDGDLARIKGMASSFGGFLDSVLDRYSDALVILGLTVWAAGDENSVYVWTAGFAALAGTFAVTYTRARIEHAPGDVFDRGITSIASRDIRLFIVMIGSLVDQGVATLIVVAAITHLVVPLRLFRAWRLLR